ncbi:MAG: NRDE family protein [Candidatus Binatia bacterium]
MCTLAVYFRTFAAYPLVIAANRDEFLARPTAPPGLLDTAHGIFGGRDEERGGTWLAVNARGVAAALLNRRTDAPPDPTRRSRGLLCLEALKSESAESAASWVREQKPELYNPFNLLVADGAHAWVATNHAGHLVVTALSPGLHLLTNLDINDPTCPRIAASYRLFANLGDERRSPEDPDFPSRVQAILSRHDTTLDPRGSAPGNSLCVHAGAYGTRSSSVVYQDAARAWTYLHCEEPPCRGTLRAQPVDAAIQREAS